MQNAETQSLAIQLYNSYGTERQFRVRGRVLIPHRRFRPALPDDGIFTTLLNMYFRIYSREVAGVTVRLWVEIDDSFGNSTKQTVDVVSNDEGYIDAILATNTPLTDGVYLLKGEVLAAPFELIFTYINESSIFIYNKNSHLGLISDIDDTVILTESYSGLRTLYHTFLFNAFRRTVLPHVKAWYSELTRNGELPTFYLSSSPWNLYDVLTQIFQINGLPKATVLLRDYGIDYDKMLLGSHTAHKRQAIDDILATYPNTLFILSGDTAQYDPDIYLAVAKDYGSRIQTIFIRDVGLPDRSARIAPFLAEAKALGIDMRILSACGK
jgi:phosphatidate phosphatase APP1